MTPPTPSEVMRERIERAVDGEGSAALLQDWLQGYRMPTLGEEDEPYVWLIRGLLEVPEGERRDEVTRRLAAWLAEILERPDVEKLGHLPDRLLYNALMLAGGLECPEILWEPLLGMLERNTLGDRTYHGIPLRSSLRTALVNNQLDSRLEDIWLAMATEKGGDERLPGNVYDGFGGIVRLPGSELVPGSRSWDLLREGLTHSVKRLGDMTERRILFRNLTEQLVERHSEQGKVNHWLLVMAHQESWPRWAVEGLPSLFYRLENRVDDWAVWKLYYEFLKAVHVDLPPPENALCEDRVYLLSAPVWEPSEGHLLAALEQVRREHPWSSNRSLYGSLSDFLIGIQSFVEAEEDLGVSRLVEAARSVLRAERDEDVAPGGSVQAAELPVS